ncbi:MAG TPA: CAP domain-containing protein [Chitinophagaceae bacterium]|nr:CAP domain-containing protein [Chitinophagaceae bacterium]
MKIKLLLFVLFAFLLCNNSFGQSDVALAKDIFTSTNNYRESKDLLRLKWNDYLSKIAEQHSKNMANAKIKVGHEGFERRNILIIKRMGRDIAMGENVAVNVSSGDQAIALWKESQGHNRNLLGNFEYIGVGVYTDKKGVPYITQIFVR